MKPWIGLSLLLAALGIGLIGPALQASRSDVMYRDQVAVLMYHHVDETAESSSTITPQLFRSQLETLKRLNYHFITLEQFSAFMDGSGEVPPNAALVTFDDGYESFYTKAYPILRELRVPAVNYIITGTLEHPKETYIPSLSRDELRAMRKESPELVSFGCHTDSMHGKLDNGDAIMTGRITRGDGSPETEDTYRERVLLDTKQCLQKLGELEAGGSDTLAYPFGITNRQASAIVGDAGVRYAFTITPEMAVPGVDPLRIPRINAGSPNISPEGLHKTITRRIVRVPEQLKSKAHAGG
ncbi:polysaccharide deacetylase family protein [Paenibacillus chartarius]|uniref:Polysaccharide deacetylase family protein n=1 Tax=Paenibacillus chartarius TaxID=747481 RepID=A0ABV6DNB1_9BACL